MAKLMITLAGRFLARLFQEEIDKNKKEGDYILFYQKHRTQDDSWETIYDACLYKQVAGGPIRWEDELKLVLDFVKSKQRRKGQTFQIINTDEINEAMQTKTK